MKNKLLSMTHYVLNVKIQDTIDKDAAEFYQDYARFLRQPLTLGMFVPCDEKGNFLHSPEEFKNNYSEPLETNGFYLTRLENYNKAKERVLFKGCVFDERGLLIFRKGYKFEVVGSLEKGEIKIGPHITTIEDLLKMNFDFELTEKQAKKYGL